MEQAPRARALKQEKAGEDATRKVEHPYHRVKAVGEPAGVRAREPARAEAPDRVAAGSLNILPNQPFNKSTTFK